MVAIVGGEEIFVWRNGWRRGNICQEEWLEEKKHVLGGMVGGEEIFDEEIMTEEKR